MTTTMHRLCETKENNWILNVSRNHGRGRESSRSARKDVKMQGIDMRKQRRSRSLGRLVPVARDQRRFNLG